MERALDGLPPELSRLLDNVAIVVDEWPELLDAAVSGGPGETLYGLYEGVPLTERGAGVLRGLAGQDHDLPRPAGAGLRDRRVGGAGQDHGGARDRPLLRLRRGAAGGVGLGLSRAGGSVSIEQRVAAPLEKVSAFVSDFRNAREWMVGVESVEPLGEDDYRLAIDSPIGKIEPEVRIVEHSPGEHKLGLHLDRRRRRPGRRLARAMTAASSPTPASSTSSANSSTGPRASSAPNASPAPTGNAPSHASNTSWKPGATDARRSDRDPASVSWSSSSWARAASRTSSARSAPASTISWRPWAATKRKKNSPKKTTTTNPDK